MLCLSCYVTSSQMDDGTHTRKGWENISEMDHKMDAKDHLIYCRGHSSSKYTFLKKMEGFFFIVLLNLLNGPSSCVRHDFASFLFAFFPLSFDVSIYTLILFRKCLSLKYLTMTLLLSSKKSWLQLFSLSCWWRTFLMKNKWSEHQRPKEDTHEDDWWCSRQRKIILSSCY